MGHPTPYTAPHSGLSSGTTLPPHVVTRCPTAAGLGQDPALLSTAPPATGRGPHRARPGQGRAPQLHGERGWAGPRGTGLGAGGPSAGSWVWGGSAAPGWVLGSCCPGLGGGGPQPAASEAGEAQREPGWEGICGGVSSPPVSPPGARPLLAGGEAAGPCLQHLPADAHPPDRRLRPQEGAGPPAQHPLPPPSLLGGLPFPERLRGGS